MPGRAPGRKITCRRDEGDAELRRTVTQCGYPPGQRLTSPDGVELIFTQSESDPWVLDVSKDEDRKALRNQLTNLGKSSSDFAFRRRTHACFPFCRLDLSNGAARLLHLAPGRLSVLPSGAGEREVILCARRAGCFG